MATEQLETLNFELERQAAIYRILGVNKDAIMRLAIARPAAASCGS